MSKGASVKDVTRDMGVFGTHPRFVTIKHVTGHARHRTHPPVCHGQHTRVRTPIHTRTHTHTHAGPAYLPRAHPQTSTPAHFVFYLVRATAVVFAYLEISQTKNKTEKETRETFAI